MLEQAEQLAIVVREWLRGPRRAREIADQEFLFPAASALPFETEEAKLAAEIYRSLPRARSREVDIAIAAVGASRFTRRYERLTHRIYTTYLASACTIRRLDPFRAPLTR